MRQRAALLAHVPKTHRQYHWPEMGQKLASKANRAGVAERFEEVAMPKTLEVDLALLPDDDALLKARERSILTTAQPHDANPLYL